MAELDDDNHVHFSRGGEERKEPVAAAPKRSRKDPEPPQPEEEDTAETA